MEFPCYGVNAIGTIANELDGKLFNRVNPPPKCAELSLKLIAKTVLLGLGFHVVANPVLVSRAAMQLRGCPPILSKKPPTYSEC